MTPLHGWGHPQLHRHRIARTGHQECPLGRSRGGEGQSRATVCPSIFPQWRRSLFHCLFSLWINATPVPGGVTTLLQRLPVELGHRAPGSAWLEQAVDQGAWSTLSLGHQHHWALPAQDTEITPQELALPAPRDTPSTCSSCCDMSLSQAVSATSPWHPKPPVLSAWMHLGDPGRILQLHRCSLPTLPRESIPASSEDAQDSQTTSNSLTEFSVCCLSLIKVPHFQNSVYRVTEALPDISLDTGNQVKSAVQ